jgi:hypothetical protein
MPRAGGAVKPSTSGHTNAFDAARHIGQLHRRAGTFLARPAEQLERCRWVERQQLAPRLGGESTRAIMKTVTMLGACVVVAALAGCSKHSCDLSSDADKQSFGEIAAMTGGAHHCMVSNGELVATHGDNTVDAITGKYKTFLEQAGWKVDVTDHKGERANGKPLEGKLMRAEKGGKVATTLVYPLADTLIETVTAVK